MNKYTKEINIPFYDGDANGNIRAENILKYFGEASSEETEKLVTEKDIKFNFGWMLYRWKVEIIEYPRVKEDVYARTWVSKFDRFYAFREFALLDKDKRILAKASTVWLCIDMDKKRPVRIPSEYSENIYGLDEPNFKNFYDFKDPLDINEFSKFKVRRSDIDYNNHVNNTKYLSWMIESMPDEIYDDYKLSYFEIIYKKEVRYGDTISTGFELETREDGILNFKHMISDFDGEVHSLGRTRWIKKN